MILLQFLPDSTLVFLSLAISSISSLAGKKADLLPPKTDELPGVPPPNIKAESEVDPALPNTDDEDVIVVVVVAVPPKTDGEEIGFSTEPREMLNPTLRKSLK